MHCRSRERLAALGPDLGFTRRESQRATVLREVVVERGGLDVRKLGRPGDLLHIWAGERHDEVDVDCDRRKVYQIARNRVRLLRVTWRRRVVWINHSDGKVAQALSFCDGDMGARRANRCHAIAAITRIAH